MGRRNSWAETDLGPRRVGIHSRKLACRSDAVDEVLTDGRLNGLDFGARSRSTGPPHESDRAWPFSAVLLLPPGCGARPTRTPEVIGLSRLKRTVAVRDSEAHREDNADGGGPTRG
jgi:hypothetical protein